MQQAEADLSDAQAAEQQVELRRQELQAAEADVARYRAATKSSEAKLATGDIRTREFEQAQEAAQQAQAVRDLSLANQRQVAIKQRDVDAARAALKQAEAQLVLAQAQRFQVYEKQGLVRQAAASLTRGEANVFNAEKSLRDCIIRAPADGVVTDRYVQKGTIIASGKSSVTAGTTIVTMADTKALYCQAQVDEGDVGAVTVGQEATMKIEAYPDQSFKGKVRKVFPTGKVNSDVTQFVVQITVDQAGKELRPAMTVEISIETNRKSNVLTIPADMVKEGSKEFV